MAEPTRDEALRELARIEAAMARKKLLAFTLYTKPDYQVNWHHVRLAAELDAVLDGRTKRLMVCQPPQTGKSELVSRRLPAYALGKRPDWPVIACSYNASLATDMSRDVQQIMDTPEYRLLFPNSKLASSRDSEVRMAAQFDLVGQQGGYRAAGVGQGITGKSMMLGIIDDPIKSREEAESETYRRNVWNWYSSDFSTRMMGDQCAVVLCTTRWHTDDLAGRLLELAKQNPQADQWRMVSFPAICEEQRSGDPRQIGEALWPTRFSKEWLNAKKLIGIYDWSALYQQQPVPPGGAMAKREWFPIKPKQAKAVLRRCRCWDLAGTVPVHGRDPDWTVGAKLAQFSDGTWCVEHIVHVRETANSVDALIRQTASADGRLCLIREWQDPGAAGKSVIASHLKMLNGYDYAPLPSSGEKSLRWRPFFVQAEGGNVWLEEGPWNQAFLDEVSMVPYAVHDDIADAVCGAYQAMTEYKDFGPSAAVVLPGTKTVGGPPRGDWRNDYFKR